MIFLIVFLIAAVLLLIYCYTESLRFRITEYAVSDVKIPEQLLNRKLILLSDLHCKSFGKNNCQLFKAIEACKPDSIVIAGDLVNGLSYNEFSYAEAFLKRLKCLNVPVYYAFGNHELKFIKYIGKKGYREYIKLVKPLCILLKNESVDFVPGSKIYGLVLHRRRYHGECKKHSGLNIEKYISKPEASSYNIMIAHDPSFAGKYFDWGADFVLSGHLHGGIIRLPFLGGLVSPRYSFFPHPDKGLYEDKGHKMIISGGLGWHGIPFRFNNLPEIVSIKFSNEVFNDESSGKARSI